MVRVDLVRIILRDGLDLEQYIYLRERDGAREFPIVIGRFEAEAIHRSVLERRTTRPMTHDLLKSLVAQLGGSVERVVVNRLEGGTFFAELHVSRPDASVEIVDARPSDAIALAVRTRAPLFVAEEVLRQVSREGAFLDLDP